MIRHIVCSGSGPNGISQVAIIMEYERRGLFRREGLDSFFGCSAGAIIGLYLLLNIPLDAAIEYVLKRPWNKFAKLDFFEMNERGGLLECSKIKDMMIPLFHANDIPLDITFAQAREKSTIDLHVFSTNLETFERVDFNFETHPNMPVLTAVMLSCAIPPVFCIGSYEGVGYADGGLSDNFPLTSLLNHKCKPDPATILCINMTGPLPSFNMRATLTEMMLYILNRGVLKVSEFYLNHEAGAKLCEHYICHESTSILSKSLWENFLYSEDQRHALFEKGTELARVHFEKLEAKKQAEKEDTI